MADLPTLYPVRFGGEWHNIYHTYLSHARGIDLMNTSYNFHDLTAKGRGENPDSSQDWVRYHDKYKETSPAECCC